MAFPDTWDEVFMLSIEKSGGSPIQFAAIVDPTSLEITEGEYNSESMPNAAGGRIWKQDPQADGEITFDIVPIELDATTGIGLFQQYIGGTADSTEPLESDTSFPAGVNRVRDLFRIAVLWTNDPAAAAAEAATATSTDSLRFWAADCRFQNQESSNSDGNLKATVTFKFKPFNKAGTTKNYAWQSGDQTALAALAAY